MAASVGNSKEGWLIKLSGFFIRTWEQRWVEIRDSTLLYYKTRSDPEPRQLLGTTTTTTITTRSAIGSTISSTPCAGWVVISTCSR
jgi:hypothetical protein